MKSKRTILAVLAIFAVSLACILIAWPKMPDIIPTHFGIDGRADGWGGKTSWLFLWGVGLFSSLIIRVSLLVDPKKDNFERFKKVFDGFQIGFALFMSGMVILNIAVVFTGDEKLNMGRYISGFLGLMFAVMGNYMPKIKQNYTFGVKTPWTLASENVWIKTHRICGILWMIGGIAIVLSAFLLPATSHLFILMMGILAVTTIIPLVYSYVIFKKEGSENEN